MDNQGQYTQTVCSSVASGCLGNYSIVCLSAVMAGLSPDCVGKMGLTPLQKIVGALRQITYDIAADATDEYVRMAESTARRSLTEFCRSVDRCFAKQYLREPTLADMKKMERRFAAVGFPGCIGVVDCAGWTWDNCPKALQGIMVGKDSVPTIRMEVVADLDLHIWHCFFGLPGILNDLNILNLSPHFADIMTRKFPKYQPKMTIAGHTVCWSYYLADGIYPAFRIFVRTIADSTTRKEKNFAQVQEGVRKSVERVFGVLFQRIHILKNPGRLWELDDMQLVMRTCVILHNMIVECRKEDYVGDGAGGLRKDIGGREVVDVEWVAVDSQEGATGVRHGNRVRSKTDHERLMKVLVDHIWIRRGHE